MNVYDRYKGGLILEGATTYTVVSGDTLSAISRSLYDNGFYFPVIMMASSNVVVDPDKILPGMVLTVPDLNINLDDTEARANIKTFLMDVSKVEDSRTRPRDAEGVREVAGSL